MVYDAPRFFQAVAARHPGIGAFPAADLGIFDRFRGQIIMIESQMQPLIRRLRRALPRPVDRLKTLGATVDYALLAECMRWLAAVASEVGEDDRMLTPWKEMVERGDVEPQFIPFYTVLRIARQPDGHVLRRTRGAYAGHW
jgi:hypothetical protein